MTRQEQLSCLTDRPCAVCKYHTDNGCTQWKCVFEQEHDAIHNEREQAYMKGYEDASKRYRTALCEDAISRQSVKEQMIKYGFNAPDMTVTEFVEGLPSVSTEKNIADKYKKVAMDLLAEYLESEQSVIGEFSGDFKKSAMILNKRVTKYLKWLDESEDTFNELVKDMWIADYYKAESEEKE